MPRLIGYARVSTNGQTLDAHCKGDCVLRSCDTLMVTRLDRLARSTRDLLNTVDAVAKRSATFRSLADAWADTTTAHGRLLLTVLGGLAEFEAAGLRGWHQTRSSVEPHDLSTGGSPETPRRRRDPQSLGAVLRRHASDDHACLAQG
jgi:hypothetical protein